MTSTVGRMPRWAAACGVLYALTYVVGNDVVAATLYPDYSRTDQAISELSATAAPTQAFLTAVLPLETLLLLGFGLGVWSTARGDRALRWTGGLLVAAALIGPLWLLFPMTSRQDITAAAVPVNDVGHLALTAVTVLLIVMIILTGAVAVRDRRFRIYSAVTLVAVLASGVVTGVLASKIQDGLPTSGMGLFERVNAYGYMVWLAVFAIVLGLCARTDERAHAPSAAVPDPGRRDRGLQAKVAGPADGGREPLGAEDLAPVRCRKGEREERVMQAPSVVDGARS
jgi:hypothetical protein